MYFLKGIVNRCPGALVKKTNVVSIALEHVLSTPKKHKI
jgi:hypothetical protein